MRIGQNPEKSDTELKTDIIHRIVIPVYIPNLTESYFRDGLDILKLCIVSLLKNKIAYLVLRKRYQILNLLQRP